MSEHKRSLLRGHLVLLGTEFVQQLFPHRLRKVIVHFIQSKQKVSPGRLIWGGIGQIWELCHSEGGNRRKQGHGSSTASACSSPATTVLVNFIFPKVNFSNQVEPYKLTRPRCSSAVFEQSESQVSSDWGSGGTSWPNHTSSAIPWGKDGWTWRERSWWHPWQCLAFHRVEFQGVPPLKV